MAPAMDSTVEHAGSFGSPPSPFSELRPDTHTFRQSIDDAQDSGGHSSFGNTPLNSQFAAGPDHSDHNKSGVASVLKVIPFLQGAEQRNDELRKYFRLHESEALTEEYHCALKRRVLLQGRMYIFTRYLAFYSNVFGYVAQKVVAFKDIKNIRKRTHFKFPNSIEIDTVDGRKLFFTSFLSRDEAYKQIMFGMSKARLLGDEPPLMLGGSEAQLERARDHLVRDLQFNSLPTVLSGVPRISSSGQRQSRGQQEEDFDEEDRDEDESGVWVLETGKVAPPVDPSSKPLLSSTLPGTPKDFYDLMLADDSSFWEDFLERTGNRRINVGNWRRDEQLGHVRDMQFTKQLAGGLGPSQATCYQSHRFCLYEGNHMVFESSQSMPDIPCGDCFTVDIRLDVKPDPEADLHYPQTLLDVHIRIPFSSKTMFRKMIESTTFKQSLEVWSQLYELLRVELDARIRSTQAINLRSPGSILPSPSLVPVGSQANPAPRTPRLGSTLLQHSPSSNRLNSVGTIKRTASLAQGLVQERSGIPLPDMPPPAVQHTGSVRQVAESVKKVVGMVFGAVAGLFDMGMDVLMRATQPGPASQQVRALWCIVMLLLLVQLLQLSTSWLPVPVQPAVQVVASSPDSAYWQARLSSLQAELGLLQDRMALVSKEMAAAMTQLGTAAAGAAVQAACPAL